MLSSSGVPENWEMDYDGKRWFYRYKPTGLIQYTWPKPGDEFPEYVQEGAPPLDLAPEEMLSSQKQRRRSTFDNDLSKSKRKEGKQPFIIEEDDEPNNFWDQPDALMYMGPGAYTDISPLQEDDEIRQEGSKPDERPLQTVTERLEQTHISPLVSAETTPLVVNSQPIITTPKTDSVPQAPPPVEAPPAPVQAPPAPVEAHHAPVQVQAPVEVPAAPVEAPVTTPSPTVPLLDSRQVPYTPVGFVAELPSELTAQCHEEIHPTPVELPGNEIMMDTETQPVVFANAFPLAPAELHSEHMLPSRVEQRKSVEQKTLAIKTPELDGQRQEAPPAPRPAPLRQNSMPQPGHGHSQSFSSGTDSGQLKFKPYNPALGAVSENSNQNPYSLSANFSSPQPQTQGSSVGNKRHSLAGPPKSWKPSEVPAVLKPFKAWKPLPPTDEGGSTAPAGHDVQNDNISGPARFPSVLQPARGRPNIAQSPPRTQSPPAPPAPPAPLTLPKQADQNQRYQAYKPAASIHQNLEQDIESTLNQFTKPPNPALSDPGRPTITRASTIPVDLPALPYMGVRPQMPPPAASEPIALHTRASYQAFSHQHTADVTSRRDTNNHGFQAYTAPLPSSSPDIPPPLKIARNKSPPPAVQNNLPTFTSSLRPPASVEEYVVSRETTPVPRDHIGTTSGIHSYGGLQPQPSAENPGQGTSSPYKFPGEGAPLAVGQVPGPSTQPAPGTADAHTQSDVRDQSISPIPAAGFSINPPPLVSGPATAPKHQVAPQMIPPRESSWDKTPASQVQAGTVYQQAHPQILLYNQTSAVGAGVNPLFQTEGSNSDKPNRPQTPPGHGACSYGQQFGVRTSSIYQVSPPEPEDLGRTGSFSSPSIDASVNYGEPPPRPPKTPHDPSPQSSPAKSSHGGQQYFSGAPPVPSVPSEFSATGSSSPPPTSQFTPPLSHGPSSSPPAPNMSHYQSLRGTGGAPQQPLSNIPPSLLYGGSTIPQSSQWQVAPVPQSMAVEPRQSPPPSSMPPQFLPHGGVSGFGPNNQQQTQPMAGQFQRPGGSLPHISSPMGSASNQPSSMSTPSGHAPGPGPQRTGTLKNPGQQRFQMHPSQSTHPGPSVGSQQQGQPMFTPPNLGGPQSQSEFSSQQTFISQPVIQQQTVQQRPLSLQQQPSGQQPPIAQLPPVPQQMPIQQQQPIQQQPPFPQQKQPIQQPLQQGPPQQQQQRQHHQPAQPQHLYQQRFQHPQQEMQHGQPPLQQHQHLQHQHLQQQAGFHQGTLIMIPHQSHVSNASQTPQSATVPSQQDKSWLGGIGKLWRSSSVRKESPSGNSPPSTANKLQKPHPQQTQGNMQTSAPSGAFPQSGLSGAPPSGQSGQFTQLTSQQQQQFPHQQQQHQQTGMMLHNRISSFGGAAQGGPVYSQSGSGSGKNSRVSSHSGSAAGSGTQTQTRPGQNGGWGKNTSYDGDGWGDDYD